jgi:phosphoribosylanthranilate isomerase
MRVKICGLKNYKDAELALSLGATELGFIFTQSPRMIDVFDAKLICRNLPKVARSIGVFKNDSLEFISRVIEATELTGIQLHGEESPETVKAIKEAYPTLVIFKAIGVEAETFTLDPQDYSLCDALIFDHPASHFNPSLRSNLHSQKLETFKCSKPYYLAGGINPTNVGELITRYRPAGIDVSSGVEIAPGFKDLALMKNLFLQLKDL